MAIPWPDLAQLCCAVTTPMPELARLPPNQLKAAGHCRWTRSSGCKIIPDVLSEASESWRGEHLIFDGASIWRHLHEPGGSVASWTPARYRDTTAPRMCLVQTCPTSYLIGHREIIPVQRGSPRLTHVGSPLTGGHSSWGVTLLHSWATLSQRHVNLH